MNDFVNISGNLRIVEDGGLGLNTAILEKTHNYGHAHEGVLTFLRKGLVIGPGNNIIDFTTDVSGQSPPDVHFIEVENMTITDTSLVNAGNVNPFIADWAETDNDDDIPDGKLGNVRIWARDAAAEHDTPNMRDLGRFMPADIDAIPNGSESEFVYSGTVRRDMDGTLAYIGGGWSKPTAGPVPTYTQIGLAATVDSGRNDFLFSQATADAFIDAWNGGYLWEFRCTRARRNRPRVLPV